MTGTPIHRLAQFWRHTSARVSTQEVHAVTEVLGAQLSHFFLDLPVNDQRHGLDVLKTISRSAVAPPLLLQQAALLHDMGKVGAHLSIIERSLTVLLRAISPKALRGWLWVMPRFAARYAIYADHARIGAERLSGCGATDLAAVVAEHHARQPSLELTRRLQRADGAN